jgi:hypothetical protein
MATIPCDAASLIDAAKCIQCIPPGMQFQVLVSLLCQIANNPGGGGTTEKSFTSALIPLTATVLLNQAHALGGTPDEVRGVIACVAPDVGSGYTIGDEFDPMTVFNVGNVTMAFTFGANANNVFAAADAILVGAEANYFVVKKTGGTSQVTSWANFRFKLYATL